MYAVENCANMIMLGPALFERESRVGITHAGLSNNLTKLADSDKHNTFSVRHSGLTHATVGSHALMYSFFRAHRIHHLQFAVGLRDILRDRVSARKDEAESQGRLKDLVLGFIERDDILALEDADMKQVRE